MADEHDDGMDALKKYTVGDLVGYMGQGHKGAFTLALGLLDTTSFPRSDISEEDIKSGKVPEPIKGSKEDFNDPRPDEIIYDYLKRAPNGTITGVHLLLRLASDDLVGEDLEALYTIGCKENTLMLSMMAMLRVHEFITAEQLHQAANGTYDLSQHVNLSPQAAATANLLSLDLENENDGPFGRVSLPDLIAQYDDDDEEDSTKEGGDSATDATS